MNKPIKLKLIIEVECGPDGTLGCLKLDARGGRKGPFLKPTFMDTSPKLARELFADCFDLPEYGAASEPAASDGAAANPDLNDLGNTPAAQTQQDALAADHDATAVCELCGSPTCNGGCLH